MLAHKIKLTCDNTKIDALYVPAFGFAYCMINNGTTTFRKYNQEDMPDSLREDFLEISMGNIPKRNYQSRDHRRVSVDDPHIGALESEIKWLKEGIAQSDERKRTLSELITCDKSLGSSYRAVASIGELRP